MRRKFLSILVIHILFLSNLDLGFANEAQSTVFPDDQVFDFLVIQSESSTKDPQNICKELITNLGSSKTMRTWKSNYQTFKYRRGLRSYYTVMFTGLAVGSAILLAGAAKNTEGDHSNDVKQEVTGVVGFTTLAMLASAFLENFIYNIKMLSSDSGKCLASANNCQPEYVDFANEIIKGGDIDIQKFSRVVQEKIPDFCSIKEVSDDISIIKIKPMNEIKSEIRNSYDAN